MFYTKWITKVLDSYSLSEAEILDSLSMAIEDIEELLKKQKSSVFKTRFKGQYKNLCSESFFLARLEGIAANFQLEEVNRLLQKKSFCSKDLMIALKPYKLVHTFIHNHT